MSIEEYLYVDDRRLDSYIEQIGSPLTSDRVPVPSVTHSDTGPVFGSTLQGYPRLLTRAEKIKRLLRHLEGSHSMGKGRFGREVFSSGTKVFRLEACVAVRAFIPPAEPESLIREHLLGMENELYPSPKEDPQDFKKRQEEMRKLERRYALERAREAVAGFDGLNIWISDRRHTGPSNPDGRGQLFLIAGFPHGDTKSFDAWSAYSAFTGLVSSLRGALSKTVLHRVVGEWDNPTSPLQRGFLEDPVEALRNLGARVSDWRRIETLYRVRDAILYKEVDDTEDSIATIGYPIFIASADRFSFSHADDVVS